MDGLVKDCSNSIANGYDGYTDMMKPVHPHFIFAEAQGITMNYIFHKRIWERCCPRVHPPTKFDTDWKKSV